jgi:MerR family transcriptional regulator, light-induced transcriptional regulator
MNASDDSKTSPPTRESPGPYRIATVTELTGVPEPTLRAWERRYGVPQPARSTAGYRLYPMESVEQVRAMKRLCVDGMAAAEAARVVRDLQTASEHQAGDASSLLVSDTYVHMSDALLEAVESFDDQALEMLSRRLMMMGPPSLQFERVLVPVLRAIGERWRAGRLNVAQEHLASQRFGLMLRDLIRLSTRSDAKHAVVLGCFPDDEHELGLLGSALRFAEWGYRPVFLGARTPPEAIAAAVKAMQPALVALSATVDIARPQARAVCGQYGAACGATPWIVGGTSEIRFADIIVNAGGHIACTDVADLKRQVVELVGGGPRPATTRSRRK